MVNERVECSDTLERSDELHFVEVMFARTADEASSCCELLDEHQIPARISREAGAGDRGIAVLVPDTYQDDALEILAMRAQDEDADEEEEEVEDDDDFDDDEDDEDYDDFDDDDEEEEEFEDDE